MTYYFFKGHEKNIKKAANFIDFSLESNQLGSVNTRNFFYPTDGFEILSDLIKILDDSFVKDVTIFDSKENIYSVDQFLTLLETKYTLIKH